jgi:hypothetical protein
VRQFRNLKGDIDPTGLERDHLDDYGLFLIQSASRRSASCPEWIRDRKM